jgi:3-oxoacyl-[acyl-carrier protein] reductase
MELGLTGKTILVAGAAQGIGYAIAKGFLQEGANVVITARNDESLQIAAKELRTENISDAQILTIAGDMTEESTIDRVLKISEETFHGIDCVVANVGSVEIEAIPITHEDWDSALKSNFIGSAILVTRALSVLKGRKGANAVLISSIAGREDIGAPVSYASAKAATEFFVTSMARPAAEAGVRINVVSPGNVLFSGGNWERKVRENPEFWQKFLDREVPLARFGRPNEIADAVLFLASERAAFVTGACFVIDGGQTKGR